MKTINSFLVSKDTINFAQTLECGQIFSYKKIQDGFLLFSEAKMAKIIERAHDYIVETDDVGYFKKFLDLDVDYEKIKANLNQFDVMKNPIKFGFGIRILKQDILETIISFVFSANNNIKRITNSLFLLREKFGENFENYFAFPTLNELEKISEEDFRSIGAGYRAPQLVKLIKQLKLINLKEFENLETEALRKELIKLSGIGPKVADCILLFGFHRQDVFPVDTWIEKVYNTYFEKNNNRKQIREILIKKFGNLSGIAQQYLFYYQRSGNFS